MICAMEQLRVGDLIWWDGPCTWRVVESRAGAAGEWVVHAESERWPKVASILLRRSGKFPVELVSEYHRWKGTP